MNRKLILKNNKYKFKTYKKNWKEKNNREINWMSRY